MKTLIKQAQTILIFSGEGSRGTFTTFTGKKSIRAIKSKLTKERCGGDRWAKVYISGHDRAFLELGQPELNEIIDARIIRPEELEA